jgi:hypothetical protein
MSGPNILNEEQLHLIELAAKAIGLRVERYTVRDHTVIRCANDKEMWNPLDSTRTDFLDLINAFPVFDIHHERHIGADVTIRISAGFDILNFNMPGAKNVEVSFKFKTYHSKHELAYAVTYAAAAIYTEYLHKEPTEPSEGANDA